MATVKEILINIDAARTILSDDREKIEMASKNLTDARTKFHQTKAYIERLKNQLIPFSDFQVGDLVAYDTGGKNSVWVGNTFVSGILELFVHSVRPQVKPNGKIVYYYSLCRKLKSGKPSKKAINSLVSLRADEIQKL